MSREQKINLTITILTLGFFASVVFHYVQGIWLGQPYPMNTFLPAPVKLHPTQLFGDWSGIVFAWPKKFFFGTDVNYFPGMYLFVQIFSFFNSYFYSVICYVILFSGIIFFWIYQQLKVSSKVDSIRNAVVGCFMCYPFLFIFQTGNIESFIFISLSFFIYFYQRKNPVLSSFFLAFPISAKLVAGVLIFIPLFEKRYRDFFFILMWSALFVLSSLFIFDGGLRSGLSGYLDRLHQGLALYSSIMVTGEGGNHYGHSILTMIRILWVNHLPPLSQVLFYWAIAALIIFSIILVITRYQTELWKKVALLICAMNLLPFTSTDYKLMHLWIPLALLINSKVKSKFDWVYVVIFSILLIPKNYGYFHGIPINSFSCVANPLLMVMLIVIIGGSTLLSKKTFLEEQYDKSFLPSDFQATSEVLY